MIQISSRGCGTFLLLWWCTLVGVLSVLSLWTGQQNIIRATLYLVIVGCGILAIGAAATLKDLP